MISVAYALNCEGLLTFIATVVYSNNVRIEPSTIDG